VYPTGHEPWVTHDKRVPDSFLRDLNQFDDKLVVHWWNIVPPGREVRSFRLLRHAGGKFHHIAWFDYYPGVEERIFSALRKADAFNKSSNITNKKEYGNELVLDLQSRLDADERSANRKAKNDASNLVDDIYKDKTGVIYSYRR
jgi:hypothetical protein